MYSACVWIDDDDIKGLDESIIHSSSFFFIYSPTDWVQRRWGRMGGRRQGPIVCVTSFVVIIGLEILKR